MSTSGYCSNACTLPCPPFADLHKGDLADKDAGVGGNNAVSRGPPVAHQRVERPSSSATTRRIIRAQTPRYHDAPMPPSPLATRERWLSRYHPALRIGEQGTLLAIGDGIAWVAGLPSAAMDDLLAFADGSSAVVFDLAEDLIGAVLLHQGEGLTAGAVARRTGRALGLPVGDGLLGRVIDPLGAPLDGRPAPPATGHAPMDAASPPIVERDFVRRPLYTGIKMVDALIPIGRGQRQLIVGDSGLGRSAVALDAVLAQRGTGVRCVYVLIGQKRSTVVATVELLREHGALDYTTVVVGEAGALPGLKYLAPFAGTALAEAWMRAGHDVLIVHDDLSTHALTYRELSLLLRRPPGREAYPGDIFYLHARLLERATCLHPHHGGGSLTALAIVETKQGDIAAYIPTNLISITDGQIYLDQALFAAGIRPAIDLGRSVSRIGGRAQHPAIKREAGRMKLDYLQFLELEVFSRFGARLEAGMEAKIRRGRLLRELLRQERSAPLPPPAQLVWLVAFNEHLLDDLPPARVQRWCAALAQWAADCPLRLGDARARWVELARRSLEEAAP